MSRCCVPPRRPRALPVVRELQRNVEVGLLEEADYRLQVVLLLRAHPQLVALDLSLHALGSLVPDALRDRASLVALDALLDRRRDPVRLAGRLRVAGVQRLERDPALDQLLLEDLERGLHPLLAVGLEADGLLAGPADRRVGAPEV